MVERVNSRVLGDAKNRLAFGVNAPLAWSRTDHQFHTRPRQPIGSRKRRALLLYRFFPVVVWNEQREIQKKMANSDETRILAEFNYEELYKSTF